MDTSSLQSVNAVLNPISATLLLIGFVYIKQGDSTNHKKYMFAVLVSMDIRLHQWSCHLYDIEYTLIPVYIWSS